MQGCCLVALHISDISASLRWCQQKGCTQAVKPVGPKLHVHEGVRVVVGTMSSTSLYIFRVKGELEMSASMGCKDEQNVEAHLT